MVLLLFILPLKMNVSGWGNRIQGGPRNPRKWPHLLLDQCPSLMVGLLEQLVLIFSMFIFRSFDPPPKDLHLDRDIAQGCGCFHIEHWMIGWYNPLG